ncbi:MAG: response regulator [Methanolinea tarda]|jgi:DNA-binding NtrC family response regulator
MLSVLVVDPDRSFLDLFQKNAGSWPDVEVATACCAKEAGDYLGDHPCDVVISEYKLPDRDGIDLLRSIRSRHGDLPFMLVTGNGSEAVAAEASRFGISAYITMPMNSTS